MILLVHMIRVHSQSLLPNISRSKPENPFNLLLLSTYMQMKDLMILLVAHTMLHLKSCIDLIVWKQIYGA